MTNISGTNLNSGPTAGPKGEEKGCPSRYQPYPEYKDSGVDWLGIVPSHWKLRPVYSLAKVINGYPFNSSLFDNSSGVPLVRIRDLGKKNTEVKYVGDFVNSAAITSDDVLIGMDGDFNVGRWRGEGSALLNQRMCCVRGNTKIITRYLEYWLPHPLKLINDITYSTTVKHLSSRQVEKLLIALPDDKNELSIIVAFLDRETQKIDRLIEKQQQLIKLLQEKRQAVISHAVTKGLNLNVKMKDSGVEWLGEIPEHWSVKRLKYISDINPDVLPENTCGEYEFEYVDIGSVSFGLGIQKTERMRFSSAPSRARRLVRNGDVIISTVRTYLRAISPIKEEGEKYVVSTGFCVVRPIKEIDPEYCSYVLQTSYFVETVVAESVGVSYPATNASDIASIKIPLPYYDEQVRISDFVGRETQKIDQLIEKCNQAIELMKERRTALISAAVTGKIDVRNMAVDNTDITNTLDAITA